jgi:hypothetical protein
MKPYLHALTPRALARGISTLALAGCLLAAVSGNQSGARAAALPPSPAPFCALHHHLTGASAQYSVLRVSGACFPVPSSVHVAIRDLTTGAVLRTWITLPVAPFAPPPNWGGRFQYVTQGDARPGDAIRFWIVDGSWHRIVTIIDTP